MGFTLYCKGIVAGRYLDKYGNLSDGLNIINDIPQTSFPLQWENAPTATKSYAIVFMDYDNAQDEGFPFIHWTICNIPSEVHSLAENASREDSSLIQGTNSWATAFGPYENIPRDLTIHFGGPAPLREHEYEVTIYALDIMLDLSCGFYYNQLRKAMRGHILEESTLIALYGTDTTAGQI